MGKFRQDLTVVFETMDDMKDWIEFLEFYAKRYECRPEEVIAHLVKDFKRGVLIEVAVADKKLLPPRKTRKKRGDDDSDAPKILAEGPKPQ